MEIIAHRSEPSVYPEQTVISARHALGCNAAMAEIDVKFTNDGESAISHDLNVSRVFCATKCMCDMTAEEFRLPDRG